MTQDELRALYIAAVKIIRRERAMRERFRSFDEATRAAKVAEMQRLEQLITQMKDALKPHCEPAPEQGRLLDVPHKYE